MSHDLERIEEALSMLERAERFVYEIEVKDDPDNDGIGNLAHAPAIATARSVLAAAVLEAHVALERIAAKQQEVLALIERNGFVFDDIGREPGNWQHLAFTLYSEICEIDTIARAVPDELVETRDA